MREASEVTIPIGVWADGRRDRSAVLRPLEGADEEFLSEAGAEMLPAARVTALLARCLARLGPREPVEEEDVRSLAAGDREALLLHLHRLTFGDAIPCIVRCPSADCGEPMDLDLRVQQLLVPGGDEHPPEYHEVFDIAGERSHIRFRLPTGADLESAARAALEGPDGAVERLLDDCVVALEPETAELSDLLTARLEERMEALDPQAAIRLELECPSCGEAAGVPFDPADYFFHEVADDARWLLEDVHRLATAYGWSEAEILALPVRRRQRYLDLVDNTLTGAEAL